MKHALREIDWNRGNPYVWTLEDKEYLSDSENLFARKFSTTRDKEIVDFIKNKI